MYAFLRIELRCKNNTEFDAAVKLNHVDMKNGICK